MKNVLSATLALLCTLTAPAVAFGQIVQLRFNTTDFSLQLRGSSAGEPWDTGGFVPVADQSLQLDLFYDSTLPNLGDPGGYGFSGTYEPADPAQNYWRLRFTADGAPAPFDVIRPIDLIQVFDQSLTFTSERLEPGVFETFELQLQLPSPWLNAGALPGPPLPSTLPTTAASLSITGGASLLPLAGLAEVRLEADLGPRSALVAPPFPPVPEAATFGWAGVVLTGLTSALRRRPRRALSPA